MFVIKEIIKGMIFGIKLGNPKTRKSLIKKELVKLEKRIFA